MAADGFPDLWVRLSERVSWVSRVLSRRNLSWIHDRSDFEVGGNSILCILRFKCVALNMDAAAENVRTDAPFVERGSRSAGRSSPVKLLSVNHPTTSSRTSASRFMDSSSSSSAPAAATWTAEDWRHLLERLVPAVRWLRTYDVRNYLKADLIAGITVGTMLVPQVKRDPTCENGIRCLLLSFLQTTLRSALTTTGREVEDLTMSAKGFNLQSVSQMEGGWFCGCWIGYQAGNVICEACRTSPHLWPL